MKNQFFNAVVKTKNLALLVLSLLVYGYAGADTNVTINFGTTEGYWAAHSSNSYTDSDSRSWSRSYSAGNKSSGGTGYSQFGNSSNACTSLVLTATAGKTITLKSFSVTMEGASAYTSGTIYLYKRTSGGSESSLATATSVSGTTSVTCSMSSNTSFASSDILKVSYVGTAKSIKITSLSYSYTDVATPATYNLKVSDGLGGYTTYTNKVKSDLTQATAEGGNSCASGLQGTYSGWRTSSLETPAGSPGTTYSHSTAGAMPADGSTLYAVYYSYGEGGYLTNTLCNVPCANSVTVSTGASTNCSVSVSSASVTTCSSTASDRYVTVQVTPNTCYAGPTNATVISKSGTTATYVSGPTLNSGHYDYVYSFAQNATGTATFSASLSTKTTYTVNYDKGTYGTGSNSSATKTCGVNLALPSSAMFTRVGYTQTGWSTAAAGNTKNYNLGANYTTDAGTTLYPYWQVNSYDVTWKVNNTNYSAGGSSSVNHGSHVETLPTPPDPASYCGQRFMGWTTSEVVTPQAAAPSPLYKTASEFPNATGDQVFHAVFADYDE